LKLKFQTVAEKTANNFRGLLYFALHLVVLHWRSVIFGMPGRAKTPLLFMLSVIIFWGYPTYVFKVISSLLSRYFIQHSCH